MTPVRTASAPKLFLIGLLAVGVVGAVALGVGTLAGVGDEGLPDPAAATPTSNPALTADQVSVTGVATGITLEGAVLPEIAVSGVATPSAGLGSGARFADVVVDGDPATIVWDAGRPLVFAAATPLRLRPAPLTLTAAAEGTAFTFVDDSVHAVLPGDYEIDTSVAVSTGGLASPEDSVTFSAGEASTVAFTGSAFSAMPPATIAATGPGRVVLLGTLQLHRPDGTTTAVSSVELPSGSYRVSFAPSATGGYDLTEALLEGAVTAVEAPAS